MPEECIEQSARLGGHTATIIMELCHRVEQLEHICADMAAHMIAFEQAFPGISHFPEEYRNEQFGTAEPTESAQDGLPSEAPAEGEASASGPGAG
jgi:hypothetical protein